MFRSVNTVHPNQDAGCLLEIFARNEIGLVVDDSGTLIGLITKMDLVDTLAAKHA
jgi:CBS-domain-containing membrane protein